MVQHFYLNRFRRHFAAVQVRGVPFAPLAKGADVDVFDSRIAIVLFRQGGSKIFCRLQINWIVPNGNRGAVAVPLHGGSDFLRARFINIFWSPVVFFFRRVIAFNKGRRIRKHTQGVAHIMFRERIQQLV